MSLAANYKTSGKIEAIPLAARPEQLAAWFSPGLTRAEAPPIYSSIGDRLPPVAFSFTLLEWYDAQAELEDSPLMQKQMLKTTVVDPVTGCWLPKKPDRYRTHGGYVPCGDKGSGVTPSGSTLRHRAVYQRHYVPMGEEPLTSEDDIDHQCRDSACWNPTHGKKMDSAENNEKKEWARDFESALAVGQRMSAHTGKEWLDPLIDEAEGGYVKVVVAARFGAYLIKKVNSRLIEGKRIPRPHRDSLRPAAPYRHQPERLKVHENQLSISETELYAELMRRAIEKRRRLPDDDTYTTTAALAI